MWKKDKESPAEPTPGPPPETLGRPTRSSPGAAPAQPPTIGSAISIRGDLTGGEDLVIQGQVQGSVELREHAVTVGPDGEIKANIVGRVVIVAGRVEGDLLADEQVVLRSTARVDGDIAAPRVVMEDGARFRGSVDMGDTGGSRKRTGGGTGALELGKERGDGGAPSRTTGGATGTGGTPADRNRRAAGKGEAPTGTETRK